MDGDLLRLFSELVEQPPAAREALLQERCGDAPTRMALLRRLLAADSGGAADDLEAAIDAASLSEQAHAAGFSAGQEIGPYILEESLGRGGMAAVWRVRHAQLGTRFALKLLHNRLPEAQERFLSEGRLQASLAHPSIVQILGTVPIGAGIGLVMELVEGPSLLAMLLEGPLPLKLLWSLGGDVLDGVAHAHAAGLIHRDLKPANILLRRSEEGPLRALVADFGLARALAGRGARHTQVGVPMGTPGYMAPEQYRDAAGVGPAADVFALGCTLFELISGQPVFPRTDDLIQLYQLALREVHPPLPAGTPAALAALVRRALRARPADRFADAAEMAAAWRRVSGRSSLPPEPAAARWQAPPSSPPTRHNLPAFPDVFVGRGPALARLEEAVARSPLVTLLGAGGIGKTRLALEFAAQQLAAFDEVWVLELAEARSAAAVCAVLAEALGVPLPSARPSALSAALAARGRVLLVVDNFEQIVDVAAETLGVWRAAAPQAAFLVTSRSSLGIAGEQLVPLGPLPVPMPGAPLEAVAESPAVRLFVARAQAHGAAISVTAEGAEDLCALLRLLDGMPLAIELAAARARMLPPAAMVSRMGQRFKLLRQPRRGGGTRQSALRATIAWSWDLLDDWGRAAAAQLSTFEGGFTLEAAEAVLALGDDAPWPADAVQALLDQSLIHRLGENPLGEPRFGMLLSVQAFAAEQLTTPADTEQRHGAYFAGFGSLIPWNETTAAGLPAQKARWAERDNIAAAFRRAQERGEALLAARLALACCNVYAQIGPTDAVFGVAEAGLRSLESQPGLAAQPRWRPLRAVLHYLGAVYGARRGETAAGHRHSTAAFALLAQPGVPPPIAARIRSYHSLDRDGADGERRIRQNLDAARASRDSNTIGFALRDLGTALLHRGAVLQAQEAYAEALRCAERAGNFFDQAYTKFLLGTVEMNLGRMDEAEALMQEARKLARYLQRKPLEANLLNKLSFVYIQRGQIEEGLALSDQMVEMLQKLGRSAVANTYHFVTVEALLGQEAYAEARTLLGPLMEATRDEKRPFYLAKRDYIQGRLASSEGRPDTAREHLGRALARSEEIGSHISQGVVLTELGRLWGRAGDLAQSMASFARAEAALAGDLYCLPRGLVHTSRGLVALRAGDRAQAARDLGAAEAIIVALGMGPHAPLVAGRDALRQALAATGP